jgi:Na+-transporting NADH:ubiquinone oxidoreductase subunit A
VIIVALDSREPFHPEPQCYLKSREELLEFGLALLERFEAERIEVSFCGDPDTLGEPVKEYITRSCRGHYPVGDPGVTLYRTKRSSMENRAWYISGQDLLLWAEFFRTGRYPTERMVVVGGNQAGGNRHVRTRLGVSLAHLMEPLKPAPDQRLLVGGLFTGYTGDINGYLGLMETSLMVVDEGNREEFLALFNPGLNKATYSRLYASRLSPGAGLPVDCNKHGGDRACIACMHCADACPADILPQLVYKAILVEEVEEYLDHGLLDCVECGLCSYVCPSKIELTATLKSAKAEYLKDYNWQQD